MLDKPGLIAGLPSPASEPIFKRREWTLPSNEFDERRPQRSRDVEPCDAPHLNARMPPSAANSTKAIWSNNTKSASAR